MRSIATYIEYTLMTRHYVFVPGIGGFLLRDIDASYVNRVYTPSHKEVHFNRFLTNDDGMLANTYMQAEGITYDEAISQIRIEVATIKSAIERKNSYVLGKLGVLSYDSDKHLIIKNPKHYPLDPECYGLENLNIKTWKEIETELLKKNVLLNNEEEVVSIPKYWLQRAASIILLVCLFANLDNLSTNRNYNRLDYAAVLDKDVLFGNATPYILESQSWDATWENEIVLSLLESTVAQQENVVNTVEIKQEAEIETESEVETSAPVNSALKSVNSNKIYYIIIASCTTYPEAERLVKKRELEGYDNVGILEKDGRCRLYLKSFTNRAEGEEYLEQVRVSTPFQKAWLLPVRQESLLSYNLKNIDNDQLPMELSHPDQRTERDKGWINT